MLSFCPRAALAAAVALAALLTACSDTAGDGTGTDASAPDAEDWDAVLAAADGQTVNWYMYGGDDNLNTFVNGDLSDRLEKMGVTLNQVKITDTVDAVNKVLAEKQAGRNDDGSVDMIWVNGENFSTGKQADLWTCGYPEDLPNAQYVDFTDPAVTSDFGVPVEGCESVWQQADSALVYDSEALADADVESVDSLIAWAEANPGRFTYPALPDFTGSMAVRTFLYDTADDPEQLFGAFDEAVYRPISSELWRRLNDLELSLWRGGDTYPAGQDDVERLYADHEIDAYLTYGPGAVAVKVADGVFPASTREAVLDGGNIANNSFVAIPYNAEHAAAALVVANELLDPALQLALFQTNGAYPAVDLESLPSDQQAAFDAVDLGPSVLPLADLTANTRPELRADYVARIEADWKANVQQR